MKNGSYQVHLVNVENGARQVTADHEEDDTEQEAHARPIRSAQAQKVKGTLKWKMTN